MSRSLSANPSKEALQMRKYRERQKNGEQCFVHTKDKTEQIEKVLGRKNKLKILELFAGNGNLTKIYRKYGKVDAYDKILGTGDSYKRYFGLIDKGKTYDVIDLDSFGNLKPAFPEIFQLTRCRKKKKISYMFLTICKPDKSVKTPWRSRGYEKCYGNSIPTLENVKEGISNFADFRDRKITFLDTADLKSVWRIACKVDWLENIVGKKINIDARYSAVAKEIERLINNVHKVPIISEVQSVPFQIDSKMQQLEKILKEYYEDKKE